MDALSEKQLLALHLPHHAAATLVRKRKGAGDRDRSR